MVFCCYRAITQNSFQEDRDLLDFGPLLQHLRRAARLSQGELARQSRCTRPYISQLEAGQRTRPSRQTALSLAAALHLGPGERQTFLAVAGWPDLEVPLREAQDDALAIAQQFIDTCPYPVTLHDSRWLVQHANVSAHQFFTALGAPLLMGRSLLESVFHPVIRSRLKEWEAWARAMLAQFKRDSMHLGHTPAHLALLQRLRELSDFERLWRSVEPSPDTVPTMTLPLHLPGTGPCVLEVLRFQVVGLPDLWMAAFVPKDAFAAAFIAELQLANPSAGPSVSG